jgi:hypothetical protein
MAGGQELPLACVPAIHDLARAAETVDARDKAGTTNLRADLSQRKQTPFYCAWGCFRVFE